MPDPAHTIHEQLAAAAFSKQSAIFDDIYSNNKIVQYKRERVRAHVEQFLTAHSSILELNAGTGEDSIYFAQRGHTVHATDIAAGMLEKLKTKVADKGLVNNISVEQCSFLALQDLKNKGPFDLIFSNFAGLNCTDRLPEILRTLPVLLKRRGMVTMVLLPPFCLWELALAVRGNFKSAFRRLGSKNGAAAHIEGVNFTCWYYKASDVVKAAANEFELVSVEGLCTIVPPSYFEHFADKHPNTFNLLKRKEAQLKTKWPWKNIGDYYIITLRKKQ